MSTRISEARFPSLQGRGVFFAMLGFHLSACGSEPADNRADVPVQPSSQAAAAAMPEPPKIDCAPPGTSDVASVCTLDRAETPAGTILTLRHPDGAFHRLQITRDGRGVIAADGAEPAVVTPLGADEIEVALGGARYRLPATVRGQAQ